MNGDCLNGTEENVAEVCGEAKVCSRINDIRCGPDDRIAGRALLGGQKLDPPSSQGETDC